MIRYLLIVGSLLLTCGCQTFRYERAPFRSEWFELAVGSVSSFANPESVCIEFDPGTERPILPPEDRRLEGFPACNRDLPTASIAFFVLPMGCSPEPCEAPLSGFAFISKGINQIYWDSKGGESPQEILVHFGEELSSLLFPDEPAEHRVRVVDEDLGPLACNQLGMIDVTDGRPRLVDCSCWNKQLEKGRREGAVEKAKTSAEKLGANVVWILREKSAQAYEARNELCCSVSAVRLFGLAYQCPAGVPLRGWN